jgi:hypothetical protein
MGEGYVPCMISERWIQFPKKFVKHFGGDGEFIEMSIKAHNHEKNQPIKLCNIIHARRFD